MKKKQSEEKPRLIELLVGGEELPTLEIPEREFIIDPFLPDRSLSMVYAPRGIGKTWFSLQLAISVATGQDFWAWETTSPSRVLYIDGEMTLADIKSRILALTGGETVPGLDILPSERTFNALMPLNLAVPTSQDRINELLLDLEKADKLPRLIIIDNLSSLTSGLDENCNSSLDSLLTWFLFLRHNGFSVMFVHHTGKDGRQRGASRREDFLDTSIELKSGGKNNSKDSLRFDVKFVKSRGRKPEPDSLSVTLWFDDNKASWLINGKADAAFCQSYLPLLRNGGFKSQKELAEKLGVTPAAVSQNLKKLRNDGLVEEKSLELTTEGLARLEVGLSA